MRKQSSSAVWGDVCAVLVLGISEDMARACSVPPSVLSCLGAAAAPLWASDKWGLST